MSLRLTPGRGDEKRGTESYDLAKSDVARQIYILLHAGPARLTQQQACFLITRHFKARATYTSAQVPPTRIAVPVELGKQLFTARMNDCQATSALFELDQSLSGQVEPRLHRS